jgi:quinoprotein glucose dehydrogenase
VRAVTKLGITEVGATLAGLVGDAARPAAVRVDALYALDALKAKELKATITAGLESTEPAVRAAARVVAAKADPATAEKELPALLKDPKASVIEKQMAFVALGRMKESKPADDTIAAWLDDLTAGKVPPELALELLDAVRARGTSPAVREGQLAYAKKILEGTIKDSLAGWRDVTHGGDTARGKDVFLNNAAVYCQRCHKFDGQGGEVGPELTGIGSRQTRDYLVESLIDPNKVIAKGFESVILTLEDGRVVSGVVRSKTAKEYVLVTTEGKVLTVAKDDVAAERPDRSAMPDDLAKKLTRHEIRDLVEFLATSKEVKK